MVRASHFAEIHVEHLLFRSQLSCPTLHRTQMDSRDTGVVLTAIGRAGVLFILFEIVTDMTGDLARYSYLPTEVRRTKAGKLPLTRHEISNLAFLALAVVLTIAGIASWIRGANNRRRTSR